MRPQADDLEEKKEKGEQSGFSEEDPQIWGSTRLNPASYFRVSLNAFRCVCACVVSIPFCLQHIFPDKKQDTLVPFDFRFYLTESAEL